MELSKDTIKFLSFLWRGGDWSNIGIRTSDNQWRFGWLKTNKIPAKLPENYVGSNMHFSIHPTKEKGISRTTNKTISCINCLYSEFDIKDGATIEKINALVPAASVVVSSGGGWHCYWLLSEPLQITQTNFERIKAVQYRWVGRLGGDPGAKDLAHMLRIPGSLNYKYDPPRKVEFLSLNFDLVYQFDDLAKLVPEEIKPPARQSNHANYPYTDDIGNYWLSRALEQAYEGSRNSRGYWLACQLRDNGLNQSEALSIMEAYQDRVTNGNNPYSMDEAEESLKSAYKQSPRDPARKNGSNYQEAVYIPPMPEFPGDFISSGVVVDPQKEKPVTTPRYILRSAQDALKPPAPTEWIVKGFIQKNSVNLMVGDGGTGKTYTFCSLAACVAGGLSWLDKPVKKCPVLIIDEESGETRISRRIGACLRGEDLDANTPIYYVSLAGLKLDNQDDISEILALISQTEAELVIIDALAEIFDGDENSKQETLPVFIALRKLAELTKAAFLVVHHSNKAGGYRGSSAMKGAVESLVMVEKETGKNVITFRFEKDRDGSAPQWAGIATWLNWDTTEETFTLRPVEVEREQKLSASKRFVMEYLTENGASTINDIKAAADTCSPEAAAKAVFDLAQSGKIYRTNPGEKGQGVSSIYDLVKPKLNLL